MLSQSQEGQHRTAQRPRAQKGADAVDRESLGLAANTCGIPAGSRKLRVLPVVRPLFSGLCWVSRVRAGFCAGHWLDLRGETLLRSDITEWTPSSAPARRCMHLLAQLQNSNAHTYNP